MSDSAGVEVKYCNNVHFLLCHSVAFIVLADNEIRCYTLNTDNVKAHFPTVLLPVRIAC